MRKVLAACMHYRHNIKIKCACTSLGELQSVRLPWRGGDVSLSLGLLP